MAAAAEFVQSGCGQGLAEQLGAVYQPADFLAVHLVGVAFPNHAAFGRNRHQRAGAVVQVFAAHRQPGVVVGVAGAEKQVVAERLRGLSLGIAGHFQLLGVATVGGAKIQTKGQKEFVKHFIAQPGLLVCRVSSEISEDDHFATRDHLVAHPTHVLGGLTVDGAAMPATHSLIAGHVGFAR